jgi:hypothetical protein
MTNDVQNSIAFLESIKATRDSAKQQVESDRAQLATCQAILNSSESWLVDTEHAYQAAKAAARVNLQAAGIC